jgi:hypothetical protein
MVFKPRTPDQRVVPETNFRQIKPRGFLQARQAKLKSQLHHLPHFGVEDEHIESAERINTFLRNFLRIFWAAAVFRGKSRSGNFSIPG